MNKHATLMFFLSILLPLTLLGQNKKEQIKSLKIAYITDKLELSQEEAQKFWPLYNKFEHARNVLRNDERKMRKELDLEELNEAEAEKLLNKMLQAEKETCQIRETFVADLTTAISYKKIVLLKKVEEDFKREMFKEYRKRRQEIRKSRN